MCRKACAHMRKCIAGAAVDHASWVESEQSTLMADLCAFADPRFPSGMHCDKCWNQLPIVRLAAHARYCELCSHLPGGQGAEINLLSDSEQSLTNDVV